MQAARHVHARVTLSIIGLAAWLLVTEGAGATWTRLGGYLTTFAVTGGIAALIALAGRRGSAGRRDLALVALLIFINAMALSYAPMMITGFPEFGTLNWPGKILALVYALIALAALPAPLRRQTGLFNLPRRDSRVPVILALTVFAAMGTGLAFTGGSDANLPERLAFQLTLPSLSEEILFRGVLLVLFGQIALGHRQVLGAPLGPNVVCTSLMFGLVHGFLFSPATGFTFEPAPILITGLIGVGLAWLTLRSGSLWPAIVAHSLVNAIGPAMRLLGVV